MIKEFTKTEWSKHRKYLQDKIQHIPGYEKASIKRYDNNICVEGGPVSFKYDETENFDNNTIVWNRAAQISSREVSILSLTAIKEIFDEWYGELQ